jgi:hypothetical protein
MSSIRHHRTELTILSGDAQVDNPSLSVTFPQMKISNNPASAESVSLAKFWLRRCLKDHPQSCPKNTKVQLPTRVIDVGSSKRNPYLVHSQGQAGSYFALTYCWGHTTSLRLIQSNHQQLRQGIPIQQLAPTIYDAIILTRKMGVKFLWIDALCTYSHQTAMNYFRILRFVPQVLEGSNFTQSVSQSGNTFFRVFNYRILASPFQFFDLL